MQLLPGQINMLVTGQAVESSRFDCMDNLLRGSLRGNKIKPAASRELRVIEPQDILSNGVTTPKTVEEPAVKLILLKRPLQRFNVCFVHNRNCTKKGTGH